MIEGLKRTLALFVALTAVCSGQDGAGIALGITASSGGLNRCEKKAGDIVTFTVLFIPGRDVLD